MGAKSYILDMSSCTYNCILDITILAKATLLVRFILSLIAAHRSCQGDLQGSSAVEAWFSFGELFYHTLVVFVSFLSALAELRLCKWKPYDNNWASAYVQPTIRRSTRNCTTREHVCLWLWLKLQLYTNYNNKAFSVYQYKYRVPHIFCCQMC